jgi:putative membrane protein
MNDLFSDNDRQRIADAIGEAEAVTSAEIVPYVVVQSGAYPAARWRGGVLGVLLVVSATALLRTGLAPGLLPYVTDLYVLVATFGLGLIGAVTAGTVPPATRLLTPADEQRRAVYRRAVEAFLDQEMFDTQDRTGILLFVSLMEHRIEVLADQGIDEQVDDTAWTDVADHIRRGIENDRLTQGLLNGIDRCGAILDEHGVDARPDDEDGLSNRLRREEE